MSTFLSISRTGKIISLSTVFTSDGSNLTMLFSAVGIFTMLPNYYSGCVYINDFGTGLH